MKTKIFLVLFLLIITSLTSNSQENEDKKFHSYHSLGLFISHTQEIESLNENSEKEWLSFPSWELNYNFKFSPEWSIGLHNDVSIETIEIEKQSNSNNEEGKENEGESTETEIEKSYPFASAVMFSFKPVEYFSFLLGAGGEFVKSDSYFLVRTGAEYGYEINENLELNANITYDFKINIVNSLSIALGITTIF